MTGWPSLVEGGRLQICKPRVQIPSLSFEEWWPSLVEGSALLRRRSPRGDPAVRIRPTPLTYSHRVTNGNDMQPTTLDEAVEELFEQLPDEELDEIREMEEDQFVASAHFFFGMSIRNEFGLWEGSELAEWFQERDVGHPDSMSGIITRALHRFLNDRPLELNEMLRHSH